MSETELKSGMYLNNGAYRIERTLGQGGFGITYEAEQVSLGRKVAVKEFYMKEHCNRDGGSRVSVPSTGSRELVEKFREKFVKEARMLAGFKHQSIVKVYDVFEENGTAYYVMEYLDGGTLQRLVNDKGRLGEDDALKYIAEVADALGYIHSRNTLHLDVKPGNIMLDSDGRAVLIDFGISKHVDSEGHLTSSTPLGISKGYAPFEQVAQELSSTYSAATDIYSLGATLFFLLTGKRPPEASALLKGLSTSDLESAGVSDSTINAIKVAMQVSNEDRPQSICDFKGLLNGNTRNTETVKQRRENHVSDESTQIVAQAQQTAVEANIKSSGGSINGHEWVDLGLSVKWATCNVEATKPEEYGDFFAWGETRPKVIYDFDNLKYCIRKPGIFSNAKFSKYGTENEYGGADNLSILDLSDDAARANWGGSWRMPTLDEIKELKEQCSWQWTTVNGHNGYRVTSKRNGRSIFLPAAGYRNGSRSISIGSYGCYWSSSLSTNFSAYGLYFTNSGFALDRGRSFGRSVRAVSE